jgi:hypothetical protein
MCETLPAEFFEPLHQLVKKIKIKPKSLTSNRRGFPERHRAITFGITRGRFNGITGVSHFSKKYPEIYAEIIRIGRRICPFEFTSIHLNNNVVCPPHYDSKNVGESLLVSFGDYEGCKIVIRGENTQHEVYDAKYTPLIFNGSLLEHWNTNDLIGNKYSLVYFRF